ncbi:MAG TPA: 3-deoxy-D-manno-octulosonic acid transferase [Blastocatellia bacterium]|nr:3-deoxy-D-manno-octulosonic acid transferase [Blastocatellia bacterium]
MYLLYSLTLWLAFVALLPYFIYQAIRHGKYAGSFKQRLGRLPDHVGSDGRNTIWVHAVSVGEFIAARPLIERLKRELPEHRIVVSTTTLTGQSLARSQQGKTFDAAFYFPFDWTFAVRRSLEHVKPALVVILETELWPNFLRECRRRGVTTVLANGRISTRSFTRYGRVRRFIAKVLGDLSLLIVQSDADRERVIALGARSDHLLVCGNLKYDAWGEAERGRRGDAATRGRGDGGTRGSAATIDEQFGLSASEHLIVAGSTAPGEEAMLLDALLEVRRATGLDRARVLIAPRHPERFDEVAGLIARSGFSFARRTIEGSEGRRADVVLLDSIGELAAVYGFASVVFVGGSLVPRGGHNVIEPASHAKPIIVGPHTENFRQIVSDFLSDDALVQLESGERGGASALARELVRLLTDRDAARAIGERARRLLDRNQGATECTVTAILRVVRDA